MPQRWWIRWPGVATGVRAEHLHAVLTGWLDRSDEEHAGPKPYALTPPTTRDGVPGIEVSTWSEEAARRLGEALPGPTRVRVGSSYSIACQPRLLQSTSWADLARATGDRAWHLELRTPTTFRRGTRSTPLPEPAAILNGLRGRWERWSPLPLPSTDVDDKKIMVTDLDLTSAAGDWSRRSTAGSHVSPGSNSIRNSIVLSGSVGFIRLEAPDRATAGVADALFRFAEYTGVGAYTARGFGVMRLVRTRQPGGRARPAPALTG